MYTLVKQVHSMQPCNNTCALMFQLIRASSMILHEPISRS